MSEIPLISEHPEIIANDFLIAEKNEGSLISFSEAWLKTERIKLELE